jgi:hypothetical protein
MQPRFPKGTRTTSRFTPAASEFLISKYMPLVFVIPGIYFEIQLLVKLDDFNRNSKTSAFFQEQICLAKTNISVENQPTASTRRNIWHIWHNFAYAFVNYGAVP